MTTRRQLLANAALLFAGLEVNAHVNAARADNPTPPGKMAFIKNGAVWEWSNGETSQLIDGTDITSARWSPSGGSLLYVRSGNSYSDLFIYNLDVQTETQLTFNQPDTQEGTPEYAAAASWAIDPSWSTAGAIGFISDAGSSNDTFALWMLDSAYAGSPYLARVIKNEDNIDSLSLAPDGAIGAYVERLRNDDGTSTTNVVLRDLTDGKIFALPGAGDGAFDPAFGPDGQSVAFAQRDASRMTDIWIASRAGGAAVRVTTGFQATNPVWSGDGAWIAFIRMIDFNFQVWVVPMTGTTAGTPFELFDANGIDVPSGLSWITPAPS